MPGQVVILNGAPRSGKSSIAASIQESFDGPWMNLGVDLFMAATSAAYRPGIGLRPGGERPDLEPFVVTGYHAMYDSIAAHSRAGINVVVDVQHHDSYSRPLGIIHGCAQRLAGLPVLFVGVRCDIAVIMARRNAGQPGRETAYVLGTVDDPIPAPVVRWQDAVHQRAYDVEVDTSASTPAECARPIQVRLGEGPPGSAFHRLAIESW